MKSLAVRWSELVERQQRRLSQSLFDELLVQPPGRWPRRPWHARPGRALLVVCAALVYALSMLLALGGLASLLGWAGPGGMLGILLGLIGLLMAWCARPRRLEGPEEVLERHRYPMLYRLSDRMAERLGAAPVHSIGLSADFNASFWLSAPRWAPWRKRSHIELGAPLLASLSLREGLPGVLAHELSHGVNGDQLRGRFVGGALQTLMSWSSAARPDALGQAGMQGGGPVVALIALPFELAMLALSELLFWAGYGLWLLALRESQRAEYLADGLAAQAAGSAALLAGLESTLFVAVVDSALRRHALTQPDEPILPGIRAALEAVDGAGREALWEENRKTLGRADQTHPPTHWRAELLRQRPAATPAALLGETEWAGLEQEIQELVERQRLELVNRKLDAAYCG